MNVTFHLQVNLFCIRDSIDSISPLAYSIFVQDPYMLRRCLELGADPNRVVADSGLTPLQLVVRSDNIHLTKLLLGIHFV